MKNKFKIKRQLPKGVEERKDAGDILEKKINNTTKNYARDKHLTILYDYFKESEVK